MNDSQPTILPPPTEPVQQPQPIQQPAPVQQPEIAMVNQSDPIRQPINQPPVRDSTPIGDSGEPLRSDYQTPNYGEAAPEGQQQNIAGVPEEFLHLFEHDDNEVMLDQAVRHPIGVISIFAFAGITIFMIIVGLIFLGTDTSLVSSLGLDVASVMGIGGVVAIVLIVLIAGGAAIAANVYKKSRLILTNQKIVVIQYHSLISREISQLNIGEVEDVNVSQPTLFDRIFKTGRITIETAGDQNNYVLTQVEDPYEFARKTIQMHEGSIAEYGN